RINSLLYDHTSVLKMIEWRWNLEPLTARDASDEIANLALALNFSSPNRALPALPVIAKPPLDSCTLDDIIELFDESGAPVVNPARATTLAQSKNNRGEDNETYDFYLLLKSQRVKGWQLPASLKDQ
ncbi:MAG: hypothetical protein WBF42_13625, partial [Terracidiphilus sp.]